MCKNEVLGTPHLSHSCHMDCKTIIGIHSHLIDFVILIHDIFKLAVSPPSKRAQISIEASSERAVFLITRPSESSQRP